MTVASTTDVATARDELLARGVLYRALKLGLDRPTQETHRAFFDNERRQALRLAARWLEHGRPGALAAAVDLLYRDAPPQLEQLERSYEHLFGHTLRGRVCPYECEYGRRAMLQQAHELADLAGFYAAFGLKASETRHERPDHVACQFEFLEFLVRKEDWALENGDAEMAQITREAGKKFLRDHLSRFGRAFAHTLEEAAPGEFYGSLGGLCQALLRFDCERLELALGPKVLELASTAPDHVPMACGSAGSDDLVQLGQPGQSGQFGTGGSAPREP
ncbi:MAG: hypothetical protein GY769_21860 [bacterium]|nr:hypothetical protein [bacterium]